jgi:hypothetical protein
METEGADLPRDSVNGEWLLVRFGSRQLETRLVAQDGVEDGGGVV